MIPYTTPKLILRLNPAYRAWLNHTVNMRVDIRQGNTLLQKRMEDLQIKTDSKLIFINLGQEESGLFSPGWIEIQVHGLTNEGCAWKTPVVKRHVSGSLTGEVIS